MPRLASLPLPFLFMPQRSSLSSPRLRFWSRWRLWCPCWTALISKVPLWGCSSTTLLGEVGGWAGLPWAQASSAPCLYLTLGVPDTCTGIKISRAESSASEYQAVWHQGHSCKASDLQLWDSFCLLPHPSAPVLQGAAEPRFYCKSSCQVCQCV